MHKTVIGVMGPGSGASLDDLSNAYELGRLIAANNWVTLSGGRNAGVMDAVSQGAKSAGGFVIGILPTQDRSTYSSAIDVAIVTDMGNARNAINVLSSRVVVACGMGCGTASEIALALKSKIPVILLGVDAPSSIFFQQLSPSCVSLADTPHQVIEIVQQRLVTHP